METRSQTGNVETLEFMYIVKVDNRTFKVNVEKESDGFKVSLDGKSLKVAITQVGTPSHFALILKNKTYDITIDDEPAHNFICGTVNNELFKVEVKDERIQGLEKLEQETEQGQEVHITAPMPGLVVEIEVKEGETVKMGQGVIIVEAMKMQNELKAPKDGIVKEIWANKWTPVNSGDVLMVIG